MAPSVLAKSMTEDQLLQAITEAATWNGWRWHHIRRSDRAQQMGHSGFPDLVLARRGRVLFMELKADKGTVSPDQIAWIEALHRLDQTNDQVRAIFVRPDDLDHVLAMLA